MGVSHPLSSSTVAVEYRSLYTYLNNRFAAVIVLTFAQIETLLGFALPDQARSQPEWWGDGEVGGCGPSGQASSWRQAHRNATPNLRAQTVMFERVNVQP